MLHFSWEFETKFFSGLNYLDDNRDRYGRDRRNWGQSSSDRNRWGRQPNSSSQWMHGRSKCTLNF